MREWSRLVKGKRKREKLKLTRRNLEIVGRYMGFARQDEIFHR